ncbi:MAG: hypothetical protein V4714_16700 [Bacteroidota bacterium]
MKNKLICLAICLLIIGIGKTMAQQGTSSEILADSVLLHFQHTENELRKQISFFEIIRKSNRKTLVKGFIKDRNNSSQVIFSEKIKSFKSGAILRIVKYTLLDKFNLNSKVVYMNGRIVYAIEYGRPPAKIKRAVNNRYL